MDIISLKGPHRVVRFSRSDGSGDAYWYRSETNIGTGLSLGSTYETLAKAEEDFIYTLLHDPSPERG